MCRKVCAVPCTALFADVPAQHWQRGSSWFDQGELIDGAGRA